MNTFRTFLPRAASLAATTLLAGLASAGPPIRSAAFLEAKAQQPQAFIENRGQWAPEARFLMTAPSLNYWVTNDGLVLDSYRIVDSPEGKVREGQVVRMTFVGGGEQAEAIGLNPHFGIRDYLTPETGGQLVRGVRSYDEAGIRSLYPGIDFRNYLQEGLPRWDLIVNPGADPRQIRMRFDGAKGLRVDSNGDLLIETEIGVLRQAGLHAYQNIQGRKVPVGASFSRISSNTFAFMVGRYNPQYPLIIDPLVYGTHFGGDPNGLEPGFDEVRHVVSDAQNNFYFTGRTLCPRFPITHGFYGNVSVQGTDAFLVKMTGDSYAIAYAVFIGGAGTDIGYWLSFNADQDKLWLAGTTTSATLPGTDGSSLFSSRQGATDIFLYRFNVNPITGVTPEYATFYGAAGVTPILAKMQVSPVTGQVIVYGEAGAAGLPGITDPFPGGGAEAFFIAINAAGSAINFGHYIGGNGVDNAGGMDIDVGGNLYFVGNVVFSGNQDTGNTGSPRFVTTPGVYENGRLLRFTDGFVRKYDKNGAMLWSALLGGSGNDMTPPSVGDPIQSTPPLNSVARVAADTNGDLYISGIARSFNFPRTPNTFGETFNNSPVVTMTKISSDGTSIVYSTHLRTTGRVYANAIGVDGRGYATLVGTVSFDLPPLPGPTIPGSIVTTEDAIDDEYNRGDEMYPPPPLTQPSTQDGFITVVNANATGLVYSSYIGEDANDECWTDFVDFANSVWVCGYTANAPFQTGPTGINAGYLSQNAIKRTNDGAGDGWFVKLRVKLPIIQSVTLSPTNVAGGLGATSVATVTLRDPAPQGGVTLIMTSERANVASLDPNVDLGILPVTIPQGQTTAQVTLYTRPVTVVRTVKIRATLEGDFKEQVLTVSPWLSGFTVNPASVYGGNSLTGRVQLFQVAPAGGVDVQITANAPSVLVFPAVVNVPAGSDNVVFTIGTKGVTIPTIIKMTAFLLGVPKTANFTILPAKLRDTITFNPDRVNGGTTSMGRVSLDGVAGADIVVDITKFAGVNGATFPAQVTIPKDASFVDFPVVPPKVSTDDFLTLKATRGSETAIGTLYIDANDLDRVELDETNILGGNQVKGRVHLEQPAQQGGMVVNVSISDPTIASIDKTTVTIPTGQTVSDDFTISTNKLSQNMVLTVTASKPGYTDRTANLNIRLLDFTLTTNKDSVTGGSENITGTITLSEAAPLNGALITLQSSDTNAATVPASISIPQGQTTGTFTITTKPVTNDTNVTITATLATVPNATVRTKVITVTGLSVTMQVVPSSVRGGTNAQGIATLTKPAGPGGVVLTLSSANPAVAQVPATVTVLQGQTQATFNITTTPVAQDTPVAITATLPSGSSGSATLAVTAARVIGIALNPSQVLGGDPSTATVTIDGPAPSGGLVVQVNTDRPDICNVPSSVTVPAGATSTTFPVNTAPVSQDTQATVTATYLDSTRSATLGILAPAFLMIELTPSTVKGGGSVECTVTIDRPAGVGGLVVLMSASDPNLLTNFPSQIVIPEGQIKGSFTFGTKPVSRTYAVEIIATIPSRSQQISTYLIIVR
jgi:hypothetical protein